MQPREPRPQRTDVICRRLSGVPIMILILHARIANMARALEQRTICPAGQSWRRWRSSSRSARGFFERRGAGTRARLGRTFRVEHRALTNRPRVQLHALPRRPVFAHRELEPVLAQHVHVLERDQFVRRGQFQHLGAVHPRVDSIEPQ